LISTDKYRIIIAPIGAIDASLCETVGEEATRHFGFPSVITPFTEEIAYAFDSQRQQYHSTPILERLAQLAPPRTLKLLAITQVDLFIPILTHVYGEAQLGGMAAIVSGFRLQQELSGLHAESFVQRMVKEALHELGHTFNLLHCKDRTCIMHYCRSIADVDRKSDQLCRYCRILLDDEIKRVKESESG